MPTVKPSQEDHRALASWAADCAEHVLRLFEALRPDDERPRAAIAAARAWARGELKVGPARAAALAAHAAARAVPEGAAREAARAAGHAAGSAHMPGHARIGATYAARAAALDGAERERDWQARRLPKHLEAVGLPTRATGWGRRGSS